MIADNVKKILLSNKAVAKKMYGQNFLLDKNILEKIINYGIVTKEDNVIEIGPGIGCLTEFLAMNAKQVLCYEIDNEMVSILSDVLNNYSNIAIENIDFLKANINNDIKRYFDNAETLKVISNLPYNITTPTLFKLLNETDIPFFLFMIQKEVGLRLTGKPSTKDYNALSVLMKYKTNSEIVATVSPNSFFPAPKVESVLLKVQIVKNDYGLKNEAKFIDFIQNIFLQRRKTLVNNINASYGIQKDEIEKKIMMLGYNQTIRSEALNLEEIINIYRIMFE